MRDTGAGKGETEMSREADASGVKREETEDRANLWMSFVIAFSMYSRIPMPMMEWSDVGMRYALCFFPLIGVLVGVAQAAVATLAVYVGLGEIARCAIGTAIPLLLTGGIHMDGFLDTVDARSSFSERERRLEILKDPHVGAFAVTGCGVYLLLYTAAFGEMGREAFPALVGIHVMTRALSGLSVTLFPKAKKDGLASTFSAGAKAGVVGVVMGLWWLAAVAFLCWRAGAGLACGMAVAELLVYVWYYRMAMREFGGMTGDLAGFFLQTAEVILLAVLAACR